MTVTARKRQPVTIAEFDAFLDDKGDDACLYELLDGEIVMMTNPNSRHDMIVFNIMARLSPAMLARGCMLHANSMRIQRTADPNDGIKPRPDLMVSCGRRDPKSQFVSDPIVVVEVLSPSTRRNDQFRKLPFYLSLASTRHVVIVHQDERRTEHWSRTDEAAAAPVEDVIDGWSYAILPLEGRTLELAAVAFQMPVDDVYRDVEFDTAPATT